MRGLEREDHRGDADAVVEVACREVRRRDLGEERRGELLRRRLAGAPRDRDDTSVDRFHPPLREVRAREATPRDQRVVDLDDARVLGEIEPPPLLDDDDARALLHGRGDERVTVVRLATERDEDAARHDGAAIAEHARGRLLRARAPMGDRPAGRERDLRKEEARAVRRDRRRHQVSFFFTPRRCASASLASTRSSNGRFSVPTIW